jgi:FAD/FMN-containing dehydrogenase
MPVTTPFATEALRAASRGPVVTPCDPEYDEMRTVYNAMIDRRPAVLCRCADAADVIEAVRFARDNGLVLSVRGGGHGIPGYAMNDGGLVVDLSAMRHVLVDPAAERALVDGGATWADVDHATAAFGRAVPAGVISTTGVGGLTLGGGTGHLTRAFGLTCDSLVAADVVTADGQLVRASEGSHPELFWALRGGGGNFGVVINFEFRLHPVGTVLGGPIFYSAHEAADLLAFYRDFMREAPTELGAFFGFHMAPPLPFLAPEHHGRPVCLVAVCWPGDPEEGREVLRPLRDLPASIGDGVDEMSLPALNSGTDALAPPGLHNYLRGQFIEDLTDELIAVHTAEAHGLSVPTISSAVHLYPVDGAASTVASGDTAFSHRDARYSTVVAALWDDPRDTDANVRWVRNYWADLQGAAPRGGYVNFLADDDGAAGVRATYRDNYERLAAVKLAYDPNNVFRMNQNIEPA